MLNFDVSNCWDIFGLTLCCDDGPHLVGPLVHLPNQLDQSVTGGHDLEMFLSTVIVWRSAWPSGCDIPGTAPYRNGTVLRCVPTINTEYFHSIAAMIPVLIYRPSGVPFNLTPACCRQRSERHLVVNHLRLPDAGRWNDVLRHESHGVQGIPVTGQLPCQLLQMVALLPACTSHPAPATTLGMMTLPLTHWESSVTSSGKSLSVTSRIR